MNNDQNIPFLDRERENIQEATVQANNNVNEQKINDVNNKIKVKKKNRFLSFLIIVICLILAVSLTYYGVKYITKKMNDVTKSTTTTELVSDPIKEYINDINKISKETPQLVKLAPAGADCLVDLEEAGGLSAVIKELEESLGCEAIKEFLPMQPGDVYQTYADVSELERDFDFKPATTIEEGLGKFAAWYKDYYKN